LVIALNTEIEKIDGKSFIHHGGTESTERGLFFDLSAKLSGQIKILTPAGRHRIIQSLMIDANDQRSVVTGAAIRVGKYTKRKLPEGLCPPLWTLCLCGEICCYWKVFK